MCTPYYFYFLSSKVIQLTPYFMILLVLIFIVNRNFKLLNWHSILLLLFVLLPFAFCNFLLLLLLLLLFTYYYYYLLTYLLIYLLIFIILSIYLFCGLDLYKVQPFKSSTHIRFTTVYIAYLQKL